MQNGKGLAIEWWPVGKLRPYEGNPRTIPDQAVQKVAASIKAFGWRQPIVADADGVIIVGHTRHRAAQWLKLKQVPVHVAKDLRPEEAKAYRLADNRTGEESRWDLAQLDVELAGLSEIGFDLGPLGFDPVELPSLPEIAPINSGAVKPLDEIDGGEACPTCGRRKPRT